MSLKKTVAIAAAAGALAAISVPAMAFENEFHGIYNLKYVLSNFENGGSTTLDPTKYAKNNKDNSYFEQRARLQYTAKASDDLKLVTQFELDAIFGGNQTGKYGPIGSTGALTTSDAGTFDADGISLETKHVYLDFNLGKSVNVKAGIQPYNDAAFKGVIFGTSDATGILVTSKMSALTLGTGYFRIKTDTSTGTNAPTLTGAAATSTTPTAPGAATVLGQNNKDVFLMDASYAITKDSKAGLAYFLISDYTSALTNTFHTINLNGQTKIGPATVNGFFAAQTGSDHTTAGAPKSTSGYAANLAAKLPLGPGTLRTAGLYLSGDGNTGNKHNTSFQNAGLYIYPEAQLWILARVGGTNNTTDRTLPGVTGPGTKGQWLYSLGYDLTVTPKMYLNTNFGLSWVAHNQTAGKNASNFQAAEVNMELGYKVYDNLTTKLMGAYGFLGGYYKNSAPGGVTTPEDPWTTRAMLCYAF